MYISVHFCCSLSGTVTYNYGLVDETRIYDRALSWREIQQGAIVPEPISTTLFVIGGAAIGFRGSERIKEFHAGAGLAPAL